ncbi:MAG TPA: TonB-dependent receptor, partial [bacterium]|nr:TonB-dependent receptor [bacterium]
NTDEVAWELDHSSGWEWGEDSFSLSAGYSQKNGGAPNGDSLSAQDTGQYDADDRERKKAFTISLGDDRPLGGWRINPSFSFGWTDILRLNPLGADVAAGVPLKDQNTYDSFDVQTSAYTQGSGWLPSLAVNGEFRREDVQGTEGLADGSARSNDIASFGLQGTADLFKSLSLQWSCRLDWYATHGQTTFNPSGTLKYELVSGQDLYLSAGTGYRYPGFDELYHPYVAYTVGPDTPVEFGAGETGNPLLNPETSINLEVGTDLKISSLSCKVSGFTDIYSNLIVAAQDVSSFWTFGNVPHSLLSGVEASLAWDFTAWSTLYGNYTYVDSKNTDTQQLIPARLRQKTALGCRLKFVADAELNLYGQYADHNPALYNGPADSPPLVVASSYATANAEFKFDAGRNWKVFLNGTNLLNTIYATLQGLPMPGRYMELGTTITF